MMTMPHNPKLFHTFRICQIILCTRIDHKTNKSLTLFIVQTQILCLKLKSLSDKWIFFYESVSYVISPCIWPEN